MLLLICQQSDIFCFQNYMTKAKIIIAIGRKYHCELYFCTMNLMKADELDTTHDTCINTFQGAVEGIELPEKFTFPFGYDPHPLALMAAKELQENKLNRPKFPHNFGLHGEEGGVGKMFGVLVVEQADGQLGYLAAFSGKLGGANHYEGFVPPVFDTLEVDGYYKKEEAEINVINQTILTIESSASYHEARQNVESVNTAAEQAIAAIKYDIKQAKIARDEKRAEAAATLPIEDLQTLNDLLDFESKRYQIRLKEMISEWKQKSAEAQATLDVIQLEIDEQKAERKRRSGMLQQKLFKSYSFLNISGERKDLNEIFDITDELTPPSGAGECAAPKLLHYAFAHELRPVTMAEFWWGKSPASEIRKHGFFYPACKSKCEPILGHMLKGMELDDNPLEQDFSSHKEVPVIWEDDHLAIVNKPTEFLSVPGKQVTDSVFERMKSRYPDATGPLIVHRLDMSTSGLMIIAKSKEIHQILQRQFIQRRVKKRYVAILEGELDTPRGEIRLPLRVDLDDRPRQLVCYEYGKPAHTQWKATAHNTGTTRVHFYPITGRTHQLRVHASHPDGLNTPIKGDDLYGKKAERLYLHAETLEFTHPILKSVMKFKVKADF